ncbi:MAG: MFS transporter [Chloroflexi bacterium]|nr:MFS transporter [Chloroflexota bacterium]
MNRSHPLLARNLLIATGTAFLNVIGGGLWGALLPLYYRQLGASDADIGTAFTLTILAHTLLQTLGGFLADRFGRRAILFAMTLNAPLFIAAGVAGDWHVVLIAHAGTRMLMGTQWPALFALISESVPKEMQGKAFGVFEFAIGMGTTIGPIIGALLIDRFAVGIGTLIVVNGVVIGFTAVARGLLMRESPRSAPPSARQLRAALTGDVRWFVLAISLFSVVETLTLAGPFLALFTHDVWHASEAEINLLTSAGSFCGVGIGLWGGHWADRAGGRQVIMWMAAACALVLVGWTLAPTLAWGIAPFVLLFVLDVVMVVAQQAQMSAITAPEMRASMVGLMGTAQSLIGSAGPVAGAVLVGAFGPASPFALGAGVSLLCAWAVSRMRKA